MSASRVCWSLLLCTAGCGFDEVNFEPQNGAAQVEVIVIGTISQAAIDQFSRLPVQTDPKQLALSYPADGVVVPADVAPVTFRWSASKPAMMMAMNTVYELSLLTSSAELRMYTAELSAVVPAARWTALLAEPDSEPVKLRLRALTPGPKPALSEAEPRTLHITDALPSGSLYFETGSGIATARIADQSASAFAFAGASTAASCSDGHAISRDGARFGIACAAEMGGAFSLPALEPLQSYAPDPTITSFGAFDPSGLKFVREHMDRLEIVDLASNTVTALLAPIAVAAGARMTQPDWSPDGQAIVFAYQPSAAGMPLGAGDKESGSSIARVVLRADASGVDSWSEPQLLVGAGAPMQTLSAPSYAPNGGWIAYQSSMGPADKQNPGSLYLMSADGGAPAALTFGAPADPSAAPMGASLPTWLAGARPEQAWLVFSSTRTDAEPMPSPMSKQQLWLSVVDLTALPAGSALAPPFWLPAQSTSQDNRRALFAREP